MKIIIGAAICLAVGTLSGIATASSVGSWYATLNKPSFNPPNWIFGPVWTLLYILMGVAAGLVWDKGWDDRKVRLGLGVFIVQLLLNALWSVFFFGMQNPALALADIIILLGTLVMLTLYFQRLRKWAGLLMLPYVMWVSFATALNLAIVILN